MSETRPIMPDNPDEREILMLRTKAAVTWVNRVNGATKKQELDAFMSIFHPEIFADRKYMRKLHKSAETDGKRAGR